MPVPRPRGGDSRTKTTFFPLTWGDSRMCYTHLMGYLDNLTLTPGVDEVSPSDWKNDRIMSRLTDLRRTELADVVNACVDNLDEAYEIESDVLDHTETNQDEEIFEILDNATDKYRAVAEELDGNVSDLLTEIEKHDVSDEIEDISKRIQTGLNNVEDNLSVMCQALDQLSD